MLPPAEDGAGAAVAAALRWAWRWRAAQAKPVVDTSRRISRGRLLNELVGEGRAATDGAADVYELRHTGVVSELSEAARPSEPIFESDGVEVAFVL